MRIALLCLAACNQTWGLDATHLPQIECPALGDELIVGTKLRQATTEFCTDYTTAVDTNLAVALCTKSEISIGEIGGELTTVQFPPAPMVPSPARYGVRLSPEGDELWISQRSATSSAATNSVYRRTAGVWTWQYDVPFITSPEVVLSGPSRGPNRRMFVDDAANNAVLTEYVEQAPGQWMERQRYSEASLGVLYYEHPSLSADGLRLLFYGDGDDNVSIGWFFTNRATIDDVFPRARFVRQVPAVPYYVHLSEDCSRVYFPALDSVFYLTLD